MQYPKLLSLCSLGPIGGLGFRGAKQFNDALITKLAWFVFSLRDSPCMNALRSKYKVHANWLSSDPIKNASATWKAIERLKPNISKGACFIIGNGVDVDC